MSWIKKEFIIPDLSTEDSEAVAEELLNYIVERSKQGKGIDGEKFPGYSDAYKKSLDFKAAGKSSKVNLTLSGEMLDSLEVLSAKKGKIVIGFQKGSEMNARAEGNILGTYGQKTPNEKKARNFLEISESELAKMIKKSDAIPKEIRKEVYSMAREGAIEMIDKFQFDVDEGE